MPLLADSDLRVFTLFRTPASSSPAAGPSVFAAPLVCGVPLCALALDAPPSCPLPLCLRLRERADIECERWRPEWLSRRDAFLADITSIADPFTLRLPFFMDAERFSPELLFVELEPFFIDAVRFRLPAPPSASPALLA